jgi:hypothetical protein
MSLARKASIVGSGLVLLGTGSLLLIARQPLRPVSTARTADVTAPCLGQDHVDLLHAVDAQRFTVLLPSSNLTGAVTDVCQAEGGGIAIVYASGIELCESQNDLADPEAAWKGIVARYPDAGYEIATVRGLPALAAAPSDRLVGGLEWVESGIKFKITGNSKATLKQLNAIADSLVATSSPTPTSSPSPSSSG